VLGSCWVYHLAYLQLPANVKLSTHTRLSNGGSAAAELAAKAKGKGKAVENDNSAKVTHSVDHHQDDCLATLDIFAGCGGLSEGLRQAGIHLVLRCAFSSSASLRKHSSHADLSAFGSKLRGRKWNMYVFSCSQVLHPSVIMSCCFLRLLEGSAGISVAKWAIEYEYPAAVAFKLNHPNAEVFQENCNVILRYVCCSVELGDL